jgi:hypothetical protein
MVRTISPSSPTPSSVGLAETHRRAWLVRFEFCSERNLVAWPHPGAYDSVLPYLSIPGSQLRERLTSLDEQERVMIMEFK